MRFAAPAFRVSMQTLNNDACQLFGSLDSVFYKIGHRILNQRDMMKVKNMKPLNVDWWDQEKYRY